MNETDKDLLKSFFVSGGFAEVNPEKCIVLGETVEEMNSLDKNSIEKEIQELQNKDTDESKQQILIANAKIEAIEAAPPSIRVITFCGVRLIAS